MAPPVMSRLQRERVCVSTCTAWIDRAVIATSLVVPAASVDSITGSGQIAGSYALLGWSR